ncbi:MAG: tRNA pseudouridine(55) synthase TruB [Desulfobacterales bacterium]|nr:tRNA pseudouridine(55) synthase TruB [Desulfobacterales bacterium]
MNGVVVVDKPAEITSARVVARVKKILRAKKVGHTGALDPFATGVLVCCINQATRLARFLMYGKKRYEAVMRLGIRTDTQDLTGRIISGEQNVALDDQQIHAVFRRFLKVTEQTPPAFSALKHQGVPLYKLARSGTFLRKPPRRIFIYGIEVLDIKLPHVRFEVSCSQGTYVRTLCSDIGDALGCGAHLVQLCRTESGGFSLERARSLDALERLAEAGKISSCITPMNDALKGIPQVIATDALAGKIRYGQPLTQEELGSPDETTSLWVKVTDTKGNLLAVLSARRENGVYPYACVFANNKNRRS